MALIFSVTVICKILPFSADTLLLVVLALCQIFLTSLSGCRSTFLSYSSEFHQCLQICSLFTTILITQSHFREVRWLLKASCACAEICALQTHSNTTYRSLSPKGFAMHAEAYRKKCTAPVGLYTLLVSLLYRRLPMRALQKLYNLSYITTGFIHMPI